MNYDNISTTMNETSTAGGKKSSRWTKAENWYARLPLIYLSIFLCAIYIFSAHQAEKKVREIQNLQTELTELKWEYTDLSSDWMYSSTRSQISNMAAPLGLKWSGKAPVIINASKNEKQ